MFLPDIFEANLHLPPRVCILAPGPNGCAHYSRIPGDCYIIAVSKAILIPDVKAHMWMMTHSDQDWYEEADRAFQAGIRVYSYEAAMNRRSELEERKDCYYFKPAKQKLEPHVITPIGKEIRYGGTVVGNALQLAFLLGTKEIILCGADMTGDGYWDGTTNVQPMHGETWWAVDRLNPMVKWLEEEKSVKVRTLSPTKIAVPGYNSEPESAHKRSCHELNFS